MARAQVFWLPRRGSSSEECEDAFAMNESSGRYAVADGASEGCFTGLWARLLVEDFVRSADVDTARWPSSVLDAQRRWDTDVRARKLDWDADYWVERGASAAFLGLVLHTAPVPICREPAAATNRQATESYQWQAVAVGDACLFHTRAAELLRAFPLENAAQFHNAPRLIGARMSPEQLCRRQRVWSGGSGQSGDRLWAMTDALAKWCLSEHEAGQSPWHSLEAVMAWPERGREFASWIGNLRDANRLANDDVTLLTIRL